MSVVSHQKLADWLAPLDQLALECDGLSRVVAALLSREGIEYQAHQGTLQTPQGRIGLHCWVELPDGAIVDFRARMWLGKEAPHGIFCPSEEIQYESYGPLHRIIPSDSGISQLIFDINVSTYCSLI